MAKNDLNPEQKRMRSDVDVIINQLEAVNYWCWRTEVKLSVAIHDVPREVFAEIWDYWDGNVNGISISPDLQGPLWMKRAAPDIHIYTREAPKQQGPALGKVVKRPSSHDPRPHEEDTSDSPSPPAQGALGQ